MFLRKLANRHWIIGTVLFVGLFVPLFFLSIHFEKQGRDARARLIQEEAEIKAEAHRRNELRKKSQPDSQPNHVQSEVQEGIESNKADITNPNSVPNTNVSVDPDDAVITQGPHKGMTVKEYKRHQEYMTKKGKIMDQYKVYIEKEMEYTDNLLASSRRESHTILSLFNNLSQEQLEQLRKELVRNTPQKEDGINNFFNDLANHDKKLSTPEEFYREAQDIIDYDKSLDVVRRELDIEHELITLQLEELDKEYPDQN